MAVIADYVNSAAADDDDTVQQVRYISKTLWLFLNRLGALHFFGGTMMSVMQSLSCSEEKMLKS